MGYTLYETQRCVHHIKDCIPITLCKEPQEQLCVELHIYDGIS